MSIALSTDVSTGLEIGSSLRNASSLILIPSKVICQIATRLLGTPI